VDMLLTAFNSNTHSLFTTPLIYKPPHG